MNNSKKKVGKVIHTAKQKGNKKNGVKVRTVTVDSGSSVILSRFQPKNQRDFSVVRRMRRANGVRERGK